MQVKELKGAIAKGATLRNLYGDDANVLKAQQERYEGMPERYFSAPGRTEIGGNHTDQNHGRVLAGAVNLDNVAVASPNGTDKVRILSSGYPQF